MSGLFKKVAIITVLSSGLIGNFALAQQAPTNKDSGIYLTIGGGGSLLDYRNSDFQQSVEESFLPVANVASWSGITTSYQSFLGFGGIGYAVNKWIAFETDAYTPIKSEFNGHFVDNSGSKYTDGFSNKLYTYDLLGILSGQIGQTPLKAFIMGGAAYEKTDASYIENDITYNTQGTASGTKNEILPAFGFGMSYSFSSLQNLFIEGRALHIQGKNIAKFAKNQYTDFSVPIAVIPTFPSQNILTLGLKYLI